MDYPVVLHILSYDHDQLHRLVSKTLAKYADGDGDGQKSYTNKQMPISLLLKSNRFRDYAFAIEIITFTSNIIIFDVNI